MHVESGGKSEATKFNVQFVLPLRFTPVRMDYCSFWPLHKQNRDIQMEQISGYSVIIAKATVKQITTKPFFGKAHVKFGQCYALWCYFFQVGGVLGAKHSHQLDAFGPAFMGARGDSGAVEKFCSSYAAQLIRQFPLDTMSFDDFVISNFMSRINCTDDPKTYVIQNGNGNFEPDVCEKIAKEYSMQGAVLGAMYPKIIRDMYARSHKEENNKDWQYARRAGLNIPGRQDTMSYQENEEMEDQEFMEYCRTCCPTLYSILQC